MEAKELDIFIRSSALLDYESEAIVALVEQRGWAHIASITKRIEAIYTMVRDEIPYGYTDTSGFRAQRCSGWGWGTA